MPVTHGLSKTRIYKIWDGMIQRCRNVTCEKYPDYGGRGIRVCKRWTQFENFLVDMGHPPDGLTIDRINNDGNYEPRNCRWATAMEQSNNRRSSRYIVVNGNSMTIAQAARQNGISRGVVRNRLNRGWSVENALSMQVGSFIRKKRKPKEKPPRVPKLRPSTKGVPRSEELREKLRLAHQRGAFKDVQAHRRKPVISPDGILFISLTAAARYAGITIAGMHMRIKNKIGGWRYADTAPAATP